MDTSTEPVGRMNGRVLRQLLAALMIAVGASAGAQQSQAPGGAEMSDGEVRKVDRDGKKVTIKHGEIKSLDMPPMTMVFRVKDLTIVDKLQPGDKVKFRVEKSEGAFVVTEIHQAR